MKQSSVEQRQASSTNSAHTKKTDIPSVSNKSCKDGADEFVVTLVP